MTVKKQLLCGLLIVVLLLAAAGLSLLRFGGWEIHITADLPEHMVLEYGQDRPESSVTAVLTGKYFLKNGVSLPVRLEPEIYDTGILGDIKLTFSADFLWYHASIHKNVRIQDTTPPELVLNYQEDYYTLPGSAYQEEGYTAFDSCDGDLTQQVVCTEPGDGTVVYTVTDASGNATTAVRTIVYDDRVPPVITLNGEAEMTLEAGTGFADPGVTATDNCDGNITYRVSTETGQDRVVYTVSDAHGNQTTAERLLHYVDTTPPMMTVLGDSEVTITAGGAFEDSGCTASDAGDGDLSGAVTVSGEVNCNQAGDYTLTYSVTDSSGNTAYAQRIVHVTPGRQQDKPVADNKVVYLTFDDGPGAYTQQLLDVLAKYNVKVTFFVTNQYPAYRGLIGAASAAGHSIGIHTYSHVYNTIYSGEEAYLNDLNQMQEIIKAQTGSETKLMRFPGGSSNTVSAFNPGIMTTLTGKVTELGYQYFDWNVASGDAGETTDAGAVAQNVISGISQHNVSVVLQHDVKDYSVAAVEKIIIWGLQNGYTFLPMTVDSPGVHHSINN